MNRRDFIKFLGKATVATGLGAVVGLPEVKRKRYLGYSKPLDTHIFTDGNWQGMTLDHQSGTVHHNRQRHATFGQQPHAGRKHSQARRGQVSSNLGA